MALEFDSPDGERLLPGESMTSTSPGDAVHWIAVYSELTQFLRSGEQLLAPGVVERYQRRLDFWVRRLQELSE